MKVKVIYEIPDTATYKGGKLYDRWDNFKYFADVAGLESSALGGADAVYSVKEHQRLPYMRAKGTITIPEHPRKVVTGVRSSKGALPGYTVTLSDGTETRDFTFTGTMSCLYMWLKEKSAIPISLFGPTGTPYVEVPKAEAAGFSVTTR